MTSPLPALKSQQDSNRPEGTFFGWRVMWAAFTVAVFGWGVGFYGPPIFLHTLVETRGWSVGLVSAAVTSHYLLGALVVANMPALYQRFGLPAVTKISALCLALGILGWACAAEPWQLFAATLLSGLGWAGTGAVAINTMVAPWFDRRRPAALSTAYNGASVGGVVFSPLWVMLIGIAGFPAAAMLVGGVLVLLLWLLSDRYFATTPESTGTQPDGSLEREADTAKTRQEPPQRPGRALWASRAFLTYSAGFTIGLFAQIGVIAHLFSLLVPALGETGAGLAVGFATACAVAGRLLLGWCLPAKADRRIVAAATYTMQAVGCGLFLLAGGQSVPLLLLAVVLFGFGIGNVTSLPPLIAQLEFARCDLARAIALATAIAQATYAFAPALFGLLREWATAGSAADNPDVPLFFLAAAALQIAGALAYLAGRSAKPI